MSRYKWGDDQVFETAICNECSINFGVPHGFTDNRRADKRSFSCPNGHGMSYQESEADKLRRERDRLQQQIAQKDDEIAETQRALVAQKAQVTRLKNRAKAGLCSCCNRHFVNLERHMASKHAEPGEKGKIIQMVRA